MRPAMTLPVEPALASTPDTRAAPGAPVVDDGSPRQRVVPWRARVTAAGGWARRRAPWLLRQLPRALLNLILVLVIVVLLLACWVPGWMGTLADRDGVRKPLPRRSMGVPTQHQFTIERPPA